MFTIFLYSFHWYAVISLGLVVYNLIVGQDPSLRQNLMKQSQFVMNLAHAFLETVVTFEIFHVSADFTLDIDSHPQANSYT